MMMERNDIACIHKGILAFAWVAGTRGCRKIRKKDLKSINVIKTCESIMEYITLHSRLPNQSMSLRLASILVHGVTKIYKEHVASTMGEVEIMLEFGITGSDEVEERSKFKSRRAKKNVTIENIPALEYTQFDNNNNLQEPALEEQLRLRAAHAEDITMREELPREQEEEEIDKIGTIALPPHMQNLSVKELMNIDLSTFDEDPPQEVSFSSDEQTSPKQIVAVVQILREADQWDEHIPARTSAPGESPRGVVVEPLKAQAKPLLHPELMIEEASGKSFSSSSSKGKEQFKPSQDSERKSVDETGSSGVGRMSGKSQDGSFTSPKIFILPKNRVTFMHNRSVTINRVNSILIRDHTKFIFKVHQSKKLDVEIRSTSIKFDNMEDEETFSDKNDNTKFVESWSVRESRSLPSMMDVLRGAGDSPDSFRQLTYVQSKSRSTILSDLETASLHIDISSSKRSLSDRESQHTPSEKSGLSEEPKLEALQPMTSLDSLLEDTQPLLPIDPPLKIRRLSSIEPVLVDTQPIVQCESTLETTQPILAQPTLPDVPSPKKSPPVDVTNSQDAFKIIENRQMHIVDVVKDSDKSLTIEDVVEKPLTKLNVARAFGDLLSLSKRKYVKLVTDENLNLQTIEKGAKLT